jgi:hypothetical protein
MLEKFSNIEVEALRNDLLQDGLDSFQGAEIIKTFIAGRGYGISPEMALKTVHRLNTSCNVELLHKELEALALVM